MIIATDRMNPGQEVHVFITNSDFASLDPNNTNKIVKVDNDPNKATNYVDIAVGNAKYWVHNTGVYNLNIDGVSRPTQGATGIQRMTTDTSIKNIYGLGAQNDTDFFQKVDIDPVRSNQAAVKYYVLGDDKKYHEYEDPDHDIEGINVEGLSGQTFTIPNINQYKKVITGEYLTNGDNIANDGANYTGTISLFQPNRYYKKVLFDSEGQITNTIVYYEIPNADGLYTGTMNASLYAGKDGDAIETLTVEPGQYKQFTNGIYARSPYIPNDVSVANLYYSPLGKIIPVDEDGNRIDDGQYNTQYNNNLADASKATTTSAPDIPGWTLANLNEKNYNPTNPGQDHPIKYVKVKSLATITYIDDTTNRVLYADSFNGEYEDEIDFGVDPNTQIKSYEKQGYVLVSSNYVPGQQLGTDQIDYVVHLKHGVLPVNPDNPGQPGDPINPDDPDGPTFPQNSSASHLTATATRTIKYVYARNNEPVDGLENKVQTAQFTATGYLDKVTGQWVTVDENNDITGTAEGPSWTQSSVVLDSVESPEVEDYYADPTEVSPVVVTPTTGNLVETVKYSHGETAKFIYQDITDNKILETRIAEGIYNTTISYSPTNAINRYITGGYVLVNNPFKAGTKYKDSIDEPDANTYVITLKHGVEPVNEERSVTRNIRYVYEDGSVAVPTKVETVKFTGTGYKDKVTGNYVKLDDNGEIGETVSNLDWEPEYEKFDTVVSPAITGYSPDQLEVPAKYVVPTSNDIDEIVVYKKNLQSAQLNYWDDVTGAAIGTDYALGKYGDTISFPFDPEKTIALFESQGYVLIPGKGNFDPKATYTYQQDNDKNIYNLYFTHGIEPVSTEKQVTRTIDYKYAEDGSQAAPSVTQTVQFKGNGYKDKVTGNLVELDSNNEIVTEDGIIKEGSYSWTPETSDFAEVTSPVIANYVPDQEKVGQVTVTPDQPDLTEIVFYGAQDQTAQIIYRDITTNKDLKTATVTGKYNEVIDYSTADMITALENQGYELVEDGFKVGSKFANNEKDNTFYVLLKHGTVPVDPENPGKPGEPINPDDPNGPKYPLDSDKLEKDVTRTVNYQYVDGRQAALPVSDTLHFQAMGVIDKVTGDYVVLDNDGNIMVNEDGSLVTGQLMWTGSGDSFSEVVSPRIPGYTADQTVINQISGVTQNNADTEFLVTYYENNERANITYIDKVTGKTLLSDSVYGKYQEGITFENDPQDVIADYEKRGYEQVDKDQFKFVNGVTTYGDSQTDPNVNNFIVYLTHATIPVGPDDDFTPDTPINPEDPDSPKYPLDAASLKNTVTRTINYIYNITGATAAPTKVQTLTFTGTGTIDKVTGQLVNLDSNGQIEVDSDGNPVAGTINWSSEGTSFAAVTSPKITGYSADRLEVPTVDEVNGYTPDIYETVVYDANPEQATITYIDTTTNKVLEKQSVDGKYNESIFFENDPQDIIADYEKRGYEQVAKDQFKFINGVTTYGDSQENPNVNNFTVYLAHATIPVGPDDDFTPDTPINPEDPDSPKYPFDAKSLSKTVTRTIKYVYASNNQPVEGLSDKVQELKFTGKGIIDKVTGQLVNLDSNGEIEVDAQGKPVAGTINWTAINGTHFAAVTSPEVANYSPEPIEVVEEGNINQDSKDIVEIVKYLANEQTAQIEYIDKTDNVVLNSENAAGKFGTVISFPTSPDQMIAYYEARGYKLENSTYNKGATFQEDNYKNLFKVYFTHATIPVGPDDDFTPDTPINPDDPDSPKYPFDAKSLSKTVTRTIKYVYKDTNVSAAPDKVQTITFKGTGIIDKVTGKLIGEITWTPATGSFESVVSPTIEGYTPDHSVVAAKDGITKDSTDSTVTVTYTKDTEPSTPVVPDEPSVPSTPDEPTTPDEPSIPDTPTTPDEPSVPDTPNKPSKPSVPSTPNKPDTASKPTTSNKPVNTVSTSKPTQTGMSTKPNHNTVSENGNFDASVSSNKNQSTLPQTGVKDTNTLGILGLAIASMSAILGLRGSKKKKD
ncbi:LPXTG cell wall anchor domain-containing protein [Lactobacillus sp. PV037]|nr:LPXTG cell wall anchor domain-containing protein [Lactobacillus sp. PV037]QNQ83550.1 LPXTG cell wall anchor domain-containing protein [Lactobacillus sp. PV037]